MSEDTSWFEDKAANDPKRSTIFPLILWAAIVGIVLGAVLYAGKVRADVIFTAEGEGGGNRHAVQRALSDQDAHQSPLSGDMDREGQDLRGLLRA